MVIEQGCWEFGAVAGSRTPVRLIREDQVSVVNLEMIQGRSAIKRTRCTV